MEVAPLLGFLRDEVSEVRPRLDFGIGEAGVHLRLTPTPSVRIGAGAVIAVSCGVLLSV
jgi:hypothetical protein